jgi:DNA ligase-1
MKLPILYARSTTGKVSQWEIEYNERAYRTISGFTDGKKVTAAWTDCAGKSYNTTAEQTEKQAKALWKKRTELGYFENIKDIDNKIHFEPMLAKDWAKEKKRKFPCYSQPKLDGIRCIIKLDGMWSRNGKQILSAPHIYDALKPLFDIDPTLVFDGELFAERSTCDFNKIISCVRKTKPEPEDITESAKYIEYWIYDLPSNPGTFLVRNNELLELELPSCCKIVITIPCVNETVLKQCYSKYMEDEFEGQMIRYDGEYEAGKRSKTLFKNKEFMDGEFEIIGVLEGKGKLKGKVGKLVFDGFDSAVNGDHEYLEKLYNDRTLIGKKATVKYFELTSYGKPRFPKVIAIRDYE